MGRAFIDPRIESWWIVQVLSKKEFEVSTHCRGRDYNKVQELFVERICTNPPTAVGGISDFEINAFGVLT
jgi:hypothetical protein